MTPRLSFFRALRTAVHAFDGTRVLLEDTLGEGPGRWDSSPLDRADVTNCLNYVFQVLARSYALSGGVDERLALAALRYYEPGAYFGLRKHFAEQWLVSSPGPFRRLRLAGEQAEHRVVTLDQARFRDSVRYDGMLYLEDRSTFELPHYSQESVLGGLERVPPQFVVLFGVPSRACLDRHVDATGPLGITHCLLIEKTSAHTLVAHHASTAAGQVLHEPLSDFLRRTVLTYSGFCVFALDGGWHPSWSAWTPVGRTIASHEGRLAPRYPGC